MEVAEIFTKCTEIRFFESPCPPCDLHALRSKNDGGKIANFSPFYVELYSNN